MFNISKSYYLIIILAEEQFHVLSPIITSSMTVVKAMSLFWFVFLPLQQNSLAKTTQGGKCGSVTHMAQPIITGNQGRNSSRNPKTGTDEVETAGKHSSLACFLGEPQPPSLQNPAPPAQGGGCPQGAGISYTNWQLENAPKICSQANQIEATPQLRFSLKAC